MNIQTIDRILRKDGLSMHLLKDLSYCSQLDLSLKRTLAHFDKTELMRDLTAAQQWLDYQTSTLSLPIDYRVKALQSIALKYERYFPNRPVNKVFNDLLGFRTLCDDYAPILAATAINRFSVADMSQG